MIVFNFYFGGAFGTTPGHAQEFVLAVCSGLTAASVREPCNNGDQTRVLMHATCTFLPTVLSDPSLKKRFLT